MNRFWGWATVIAFASAGSLLCTFIGRMYDAPWFGGLLSAVWGLALGRSIGEAIARRGRGQ